MINSIKAILSDCKRTDCTVCAINSSYEITNLKEFFIFDPPTEENKPCKIVSKNEEFQLTISNNNPYEINFIKIDKCLVTSTETKKCDCILMETTNFIL